MKLWWGEGVGSRIASPVVAVDIRPAYLHAVVSAVAGVACAGPLTGSRLVDTIPLSWVLLCCRGPNTTVEGTSAQPPAMGTIPTTGNISATQQPKFSTKGTCQGPRQHSRTQLNGIVSTRRLPVRGPAHATPATTATLHTC